MNLLPRLDRIVNLHRDRMIAPGTALAAAVLLLVMTDLAGTFSWYGLVAILAAASIVLASSDSLAGLILLCAMVVQWLTSGVAAGSWWVVPAAWLLLIAHVALALAASGPDQAPVPRAVLALWVPRTILVGLATTTVAVLALLIEPTNHQLIPYGVAGVLTALVVAIVAMIRFTDTADMGTPGSDR